MVEGLTAQTEAGALTLRKGETKLTDPAEIKASLEPMVSAMLRELTGRACFPAN